MAAESIESIVHKEMRTEKLGLGLAPIGARNHIADGGDATANATAIAAINETLEAFGFSLSS